MYFNPTTVTSVDIRLKPGEMKPLWTFPHPRKIRDDFIRRPILWNDVVLIPDEDRRTVYALRRNDGELAWECEVPGNQLLSRYYRFDDRIFISDFPGLRVILPDGTAETVHPSEVRDQEFLVTSRREIVRLTGIDKTTTRMEVSRNLGGFEEFAVIPGIVHKELVTDRWLILSSWLPKTKEGRPCFVTVVDLESWGASTLDTGMINPRFRRAVWWGDRLIGSAGVQHGISWLDPGKMEWAVVSEDKKESATFSVCRGDDLVVVRFDESPQIGPDPHFVCRNLKTGEVLWEVDKARWQSMTTTGNTFLSAWPALWAFSWEDGSRQNCDKKAKAISQFTVEGNALVASAPSRTHYYELE